MSLLIDTNIAIRLRDRDTDALTRMATMTGSVVMSIITHVELEGGVYAKPALITERRASLDILLKTIEVLPFEDNACQAYAKIVAASGYSRPRILDRMIAATALVHDFTLITSNGDDFRDIAGLKLVVEDFS